MIDLIVRYWVEWALGIIATVLIALYRRIALRMKAEQSKNEAIQDGMRALLRDRIIILHDKYMERGTCPVHGRDTITDMYNCYHALGGNGTVTALKEEVMHLPTEVQAR